MKNKAKKFCMQSDFMCIREIHIEKKKKQAQRNQLSAKMVTVVRDSRN